MATTDATPQTEGWRLRARLRALYHGTSRTAVRFRIAVLAIDLIIIAFFSWPQNQTFTGGIEKNNIFSITENN